MMAAEVDLVIHTIHELSCVTLCQSLEEGTVTAVDPDDEVPTGCEVLDQLPPQKLPVHEHCIMLFDDLLAATGYLSSVMANLSSLAKICNEQTFWVILAASARPLVQVNIPEKFLNAVADKQPPSK